jgi:hypothetical protein
MTTRTLNLNADTADALLTAICRESDRLHKLGANVEGIQLSVIAEAIRTNRTVTINMADHYDTIESRAR